MRRLKSYLRSTMNAERFNGLALLATHRAKDISLINVRIRFIKPGFHQIVTRSWNRMIQACFDSLPKD